MKNFMLLLEYCESHNLIKEDEEIFDCELYYYDYNDFDSLFTELWTRKLHFVLSPYPNVSILDDMFNLKIENEKEEYNFTFTYNFDDEELGSIFFAKTDRLIVHCFNNSIKKEFESLMLNEYSDDAAISGSSIILKVNRENCFERIVEVIEKLKVMIIKHE